MKRIVDPNLGKRDPAYLFGLSAWDQESPRTVYAAFAPFRVEDDPLRRHRCPRCDEAGFMPHACLKKELAK